MRIADLHELMIDQLRDLSGAEKQLLPMLERMAGAATAPLLQDALRGRLSLTRSHVSRLRDAFQALHLPPISRHSRAMDGLLEEGRQILAAKADTVVRDAGLIGCARRTGQYEIASYGVLAGMAQQTSNPLVADLLRISLAEAQAMDTQLGGVAQALLKPRATGADVLLGVRWRGDERRPRPCAAGTLSARDPVAAWPPYPERLG